MRQGAAAGEEGPGEDERRLWAHSLNFPEKGCLLVAHPLMFTTQQTYFSQVCSLALLPHDILEYGAWTGSSSPKLVPLITVTHQLLCAGQLAEDKTLG